VRAQNTTAKPDIRLRRPNVTKSGIDWAGKAPDWLLPPFVAPVADGLLLLPEPPEEIVPNSLWAFVSSVVYKEVYSLDGCMVAGGGLVELSFVSMYALARGWFKQVMTGWRVNFGVRARASGRIYPVAISTDCWKRSCSRTMKPVLSTEALPMMYSQFCRTWADVIAPEEM
jgi:hypothetical protein